MRDVQVMRVETECGEATVILGAANIVEHASPVLVWALGLPLRQLERRLMALGWIYYFPGHQNQWDRERLTR
jgi:hypothetical protein